MEEMVVGPGRKEKMREWVVRGIEEEDGWKFGLALNEKVGLGTEIAGAGKMRTIEH